ALPGFVPYGDLPELEQREGAALLKRLTDALFDFVDAPAIRASSLVFWRAVRVVAALCLFVGLGWAAIRFLVPDPVDIAKGRPWRTSSQLYVCHPESL